MPSAVTLCNLQWDLWILVWLVWAFQSKQTSRREGAASFIAYRIPLVAAVYLLFARHLSPWWYGAVLPRSPALAWAGVAITALGFALTFWARAVLAGNWSGNVTIKVGHELIRTGPYRLVRHPIYTGIILAMAGTALAYDQWRDIAVVGLFWISFTIKRLKEEEFMRQTFGAQYDDYARTTGAIFPLRLGRSPEA